MKAKKTTKTKTQEQQYSADMMRELTGLDPIRQSPAQYVGTTSAVSVKHGTGHESDDEVLTGGGFQLFKEIIGNSSDEATAGYADAIEITIHSDQSITVVDNGRGIPPDVNKESGKTGIEMAFLTMNAGGKFKDRTNKKKKANSYKTAQGLHGVGSACVAALSDRLDVTVWRDGKQYDLSAKGGRPGVFAGDAIRSKFTANKPDKSNIRVSDDKRPAAIRKKFPHGTMVHWHPDPTIWGGTDAPLKDIYDYIANQSYMAPTCTFTIIDELGGIDGKGDDGKPASPSNPKTTKHHHPGGIEEMVEEKTSRTTNLCPIISFDIPTSYTKQVIVDNDDGTQSVTDMDYDLQIRVSMRWTSNSGADIEGYANGVHCTGKHVDGLRRGLSRGVGDWIKSAGIMKKTDPTPNIEDITDGIVAVAEVLLEEQCDFANQTKDSLGNTEVLSCVSNAVKEQINKWLSTKKNNAAAKRIGKSVLESARLRQRQKKEKEIAKKVSDELRNSSKPSKLLDCRNEGAGTELLICEGDSAKGSMTMARNSTYQAVFPVRGVTLNVYNATVDKMLKNAEFNGIIKAMGTGFGKDFDFDHRHYDRIGIYTDADEDGNYIRSLLLVFIYLQMPGMIENGKVFAGCPPLYSIKFARGARRGETVYAANENARNKFIDDYLRDGGDIDNLIIQRSKGLGEMDADELAYCLMPETRQVRLVTVDEARSASREYTDEILDMLFSGSMEAMKKRREWIDSHFVVTDQAEVEVVR